eukprot:1399439-Prymnesium_polylepis.1
MRRGGEPHIRLRGGASSGATLDTTPSTQATQSSHGIKVAAWNAERLDAKGFTRAKCTSRECFLKVGRVAGSIPVANAIRVSKFVTM